MPCLHMDNYLECEKFSNLLCLVLVYCQMGIASSSAFLLICGTNEFIYDLRILTAFELFENCQHDCDHSLFSEVYNENSGIFT